ncbi:MAG: hypothetical protein M3361_05060, partial [Candidatus Tectomicrobia bacterium]|nr:hypothetical protein [Candidatus Tectomicrobia bacterium]
YNFSVKVYPSGRLYIACDPMDSNLAIAGDGVFGFDLPEGMTTERATEVARFLNDNLLRMTYTTF